MVSTKTIILIILIFLFGITSMPRVHADNSCIDCHKNLSAFNATEQQFNKIRLDHLGRGVPCSLECHASVQNKLAVNDYDQWNTSKHALSRITCDNCHGGNPNSNIKENAHEGVLRSSDSNSSIYYKNVPETCGKCHKNESTQFMDSLHYQKLKANEQAPTCDTCHKPHVFQILNISEFHDLCSNCHNPETKVAPPDVPDKAITALENAEKLTNEINIANNYIAQAKLEGKNVSTAQKDLDYAMSIKDGLPVLWHRFDLPTFQNETTNGINSAQKAQQESGIPLTQPTPGASGFEIIFSLAATAALYLLCRRR
ncbi:MAG TPA: hypothetical protein VIO11_06210 [Candidatus Methanoperedens sp.]